MGLDEHFYNAITADADIMSAIGGRIKSTCFEVPPDAEDNTAIPNIIITDDGFHNNNTTKDCVWETDEDNVQATVDIAGNSRQEVGELVEKVRKAIEAYMENLYLSGQPIPQLNQGYPASQGIEWDWMKPCYFQKVTYQCTITRQSDEQEE